MAGLEEILTQVFVGRERAPTHIAAGLPAQATAPENRRELGQADWNLRQRRCLQCRLTRPINWPARFAG